MLLWRQVVPVTRSDPHDNARSVYEGEQWQSNILVRMVSADGSVLIPLLLSLCLSWVGLRAGCWALPVAARWLIGKDTRISGYMFESALEAGLSAAGVNIALLGPMPTPGLAYLTRTLHACAGIVISASHNPYYDNGIKFFSRDGKKVAR